MSDKESTSCEFTQPQLHSSRFDKFLCWYEQLARRAMSQPPGKRGDFHRQLLKYIADCRNLRAAWQHLRRKNSQGAGPDGRTFADFTRQESWDLISELSKLLLTGEYRHGPFRKVRFAKHLGSSKKRDIWIANVADRVVARATSQILAPLFEAYLPDTTFCRKGHGRLRAIAKAKLLSQANNVETWITQDLTDAFPSVPKRRLLDIVTKFVGNDKVAAVVSNLIENDGHNGIPAGSPISSVLLTFYVHQTIVRQWQARHPHVPLLMYLDDMLLLPETEGQIESLHRDLAQITTSAGFKLKYTNSEATANLNYERATWLGYKTIRSGNELKIQVPWENESTACRTRYLSHFIRLHNHPDAVLLAPKLVSQIVSQASPIFPGSNTKTAIRSILSIAQEAGFEELPSVSALHHQWQANHSRWCNLLETMEDKTVPPITLPEPQRKPWVIYTDGCCLGKTKIGGWAFGIWYEGVRAKVKRGGLAQTTSSRAELISVVRALESIAKTSRVKLFTDSQYVWRGMQLMYKWREAGWRLTTGSRHNSINNLDLWRRIYELRQKHQVETFWIRGHSKIRRNELCDRHAKAAAREMKEKLESASDVTGG
jgi:ribonuclease HI